MRVEIFRKNLNYDYLLIYFYIKILNVLIKFYFIILKDLKKKLL